MGIKSILKRLISGETPSKVFDLDSSEAYRLHRRIIEDKPLLGEIYRFYSEELLRELKPTRGKRILEIGAGAYSCGDMSPGIITSNSAFNEFIDVVVDARRLPFADSSLDGIVMLNTLHHIPEPRAFFAEASRTLKPGGVLAMVEPHFSPLGHLIYRFLHHEPVLKTPRTWRIPDGLVSNQIMPYHIFKRDRPLFEEDFPLLKVARFTPHTCITHLVSGGLSYRSLVPPSLDGVVWKAEGALRPLRPLLAMCMTVVVVKRSGKGGGSAQGAHGPRVRP